MKTWQILLVATLLVGCSDYEIPTDAVTPHTVEVATQACASNNGLKEITGARLYKRPKPHSTLWFRCNNGLNGTLNVEG